MPDFHVKRITLPSGKTIEIVYLDGAAVQSRTTSQLPGAVPALRPAPRPPLRRLEQCPVCAGERVHPVDWHEAGAEGWELSLRCPDCRFREIGVFGEPEVERYDRVLADECGRMVEELERITRAHMEEEILRLRAALESGGLTPFDF
jgi:hypothetical protein